MLKEIYAHGATMPVKIKVTKQWPRVMLAFGATAAGAHEYPAQFVGLDNIKELHAWLGEQIALIEKGLPDANAISKK